MANIARNITLFKKKEILELIKNSKLISQTPFCDLKRAKSIEPIGKILIIIPKKVGSAPKRNKIKRRIKAIFYQEKLFELPYNFVIFIKPTNQEISFEQLKSLLISCKN